MNLKLYKDECKWVVPLLLSKQQQQEMNDNLYHHDLVNTFYNIVYKHNIICFDVIGEDYQGNRSIMFSTQIKNMFNLILALKKLTVQYKQYKHDAFKLKQIQIFKKQLYKHIGKTN